ncbi:MAG: hypothetical protein Q4F71_11825 [Paracoccus sp. (in: a-proteobacteria)]|nr:hypothetical protein [Paracoccus sp. (in: a-proteobacteria)]
MRYAFFSSPFIAALAACGPTAPKPQLESGNVVVLERSREMVMKGATGAENYPPSVQRIVYQFACINDNVGGTPSQRADQSIEAARRLTPTIRSSSGNNWLRRNERDKLHPVIVPQYRCEIRNVYSAGRIAEGDAAAMAAAIRLGALHELRAQSRRR